MQMQTKSNSPLVSIGLPVYNGEVYLRRVLESILAQTYRHFELVISDNASTDGTEAVCREYAAADSRICYTRQPTNRGATWNFREVVHLSSGKYFLWTSHDDLLAPSYVERCVKVLEEHADVVLCYSEPTNIDESGNQSAPGYPLRADWPRPHQCFEKLIDLNHNCVALFGVIRLDVLKSTSIHGDFSDGDRCVLVELALRGKYYRIPQRLFFHREHAARLTHTCPSRREQTRRANPGQQLRFVFPYFRILKEFALAVHRSPLGWAERCLCYLHLVNWVRWYRGRLWSDVAFLFAEVFRPSSFLRQAAKAGADPISR